MVGEPRPTGQRGLSAQAATAQAAATLSESTPPLIGITARRSALSCQRADSRSDLYALGVLLFQLLCGRLSFEAGALGALMRQVVNDPAPELHVLRPDVPSRIAGLEVESRLTGHPVPTTALRFSGGGRRFGWSSDTPWDPSLVDWLSGCHLVVHETSPAPAHTPVEHLNRLPDELRRRMRLMHVPDDFDPASSDIPVLRQGEVLTV